jgi:hypothetical protein
MNNTPQNLMEIYKLFLMNIKNMNMKNQDKYIIKHIETFLDNSVLNNYNSKYETFEYMYDIENDIEYNKQKN